MLGQWGAKVAGGWLWSLVLFRKEVDHQSDGG
jgi:hypothetical protein